MAQLWRLRLTDGVNTVNFVDSVDHTYQIADGGFDIGMPAIRREIAPLREDFYLPIQTEHDARDAALEFVIRGATRSAVIAALDKIEIILRSAEARSRIGAGRRVELSYAWEGATNMTYFEVYGGTVSFPADVMSIAKVHYIADGNYEIAECKLSMVLSPVGYGLAIHTEIGAAQQVPLINPSIGAKTLNAVTVQNPADTHNNWVEIDGADLPGSQPLLTKLVVGAGSPFTRWDSVHIGVQQAPFPSVLLYDFRDFLTGPAMWSPVANASAHRGEYHTWTSNPGAPYYEETIPGIDWQLNEASAGVHQAFLHSGVQNTQRVSFSLGVYDYARNGMMLKGDWVSVSGPVCTIPLGMIQLPPSGNDILPYGQLDLAMALFTGGDAAQEARGDFISLMPMGNGLRIWQARSNYVQATIVDDGWKGINYAYDATYVWEPYYALMNPVRLEPGVNQRLYFTTSTASYLADDRNSALTVKLYAVPTYRSLAM